MENIQVKTLCKVRDLYRSIAEFELEFQEKYNICLNEGMLLCSLEGQQYSSSEIARNLGLTNSNASKVIRSVEDKGFVKRIIGKEDKRQMYFTLSKGGKEVLNTLKCSEFEMPDLLKKAIV